MRCKKFFVFSIISFAVTSLVVFNLFSQSLYQPVKPGESVWVNGVLIEDYGEKVRMELTVDDMEQLIYGVNEIPGYIVVPNPDNSNHTVIVLNGGGRNPGGKLYSRIVRVWYEEEQAQKYYQGLLGFPDLFDSSIRVELWVYDKEAKEYGRTLSEYRWQCTGGPKMREGTSSGLPLGEESWYLPPRIQFFRTKRCFVTVYGPHSDLAFAEALAMGIEYRIQQHPKRLGMAQKPVTVLVSNQPVAQGKAIALAGAIVAPISALEPTQVSIRTNRTSKEWTVTVSRNGQWVKVKAFSWEMETDKGKVKLERPVFPYKGELIVPLRQVAEALGIKVQQKGHIIALLPK
ncbi:MAG: stalk domain-containing protein [Candidatus Bathyarchaeia archaeon]